MKSLENSDPLLDGDYSTRENGVLKCLNAARRKGNKIFALKNGGECLSSAGGHLDITRTYEESHECVDDKGGVTAMNVYLITGKLRRVYNKKQVTISEVAPSKISSEVADVLYTRDIRSFMNILKSH